MIVQLSEGATSKSFVNRILFQSNEMNQNYMFAYDHAKRSYVLLSTNPSSFQLIEISLIETDQLVDQLLIAK